MKRADVNTKPGRLLRAGATLPPHLLILLASYSTTASTIEFPLETTEGLEPHGVIVQPVTYHGKRGIRVVEKDQGATEALVILTGSDFRDGVIELELSGRPRPDAVPNMRGFVGVAFRVLEKDEFRYDCFYLRPTNGRAEEQIRRNHSTQYISHPDYPWHRLRKDSPGIYESYTDLVPGEWTRFRIVVRGKSARLYLHDSEQPALIVHDLKSGVDRGAVALWLGDGTEAHYRNLRIQQAGPRPVRDGPSGR